jgi:chromosome segregation protein
LLNEQAVKFTELSKNLIKAEVTKSINLQPFKLQLKNIFEGTRIREERIDSVVEVIKQSADPVKEYTAILEEFRQLAELKVSEDKTLKIPETPILTNCGFTTSYIKHLAVSGLSSVSARIKSTCNLTGKCFEMPNVSYT